MESKKIVLLSILGTAPAVLTEAIWALAIQRRVVPDRVVVMTTAEGAKKLRDLVMDSGVWSDLKKSIEDAGVSVTDKLIFNAHSDKFLMTFVDEKTGDFVEDLPTTNANLYAANQMMAQIRTYAEDNSWTIYGLMAGGRKTMTGLFFSCMGLLSRRGDKIFHVLVSTPFDSSLLTPMFFFPQHKLVHTLEMHGRTKRYRATDAKVNLFDVPYVCVGEWAETKCKAYSKKLSYENLIDAVGRSMDEALSPDLWGDLDEGDLYINGVRAELAESEFAFFIFLSQKKNPRVAQAALTDLLLYLDDAGEDAMDRCSCRWIQTLVNSGLFGRLDISSSEKRNRMLDMDRYRVLNRLKAKLLKHSGWFVKDKGLRLPEMSKDQWNNCDAIDRQILKRIFSWA